MAEFRNRNLKKRRNGCKLSAVDIVMLQIEPDEVRQIETETCIIIT